MIPRRIKLKGFLCYKEEQAVDFDGNTTLWMLSGLNGSGKSAIFDAVTFALFGYHRGGGQQTLELINKDSDQLAVEFDFQLDGKGFRIKRTVKRKANNSAASSQQIFKHDPASGKYVAVENTESKRDGFDPWIQEHIGLDYDTFTSSVLLLQGKSEKLLDSKPDGRRAVLARIVDLERYEKLHKVANDEKLDLEAQLKTLHAHLTAMPEVQPLELEEARQRIVGADEALTASRQEVQRLQHLEFQSKAWKEWQTRLGQATERLQQTERVLGDAPAIEKDVARLEELRGVLPHLQQIATLLGNVSLAEKQIASLHTQKETALRDLKQLDSDILKNRDKRERQQAVIGKDEQKLQQVMLHLRQSSVQMEKLKDYERCEAERARLQSELARLPADPLAEVKRHREQLEGLQDLERLVPLVERFRSCREQLRGAVERSQAAQTRLNEVRKRGESCKAEAERLKPEREQAAKELEQANIQVAETKALLQHAKTSLDDLNTLDGKSKVCRACGQPITAGHVEGERRRRKAAVTETQEKLRPLEAGLRTAQQTERNLREQLERTDKAYNQAREDWGVATEGRKQSEAEVKRLQEECAAAFGDLPGSTQDRIGTGPGLDWLTTTYPTQSDLTALRSQASGVSAARQNVKKAEQEQQKWQELKTRETSALESINRLRTELPSDPNEVRRKHSDLELEEKSLKPQLEENRNHLKDIEKEGKQLAGERDQTRDRVDRASTMLKEQELTRQHAQDTIQATRRHLPRDWQATAEKVGISDLSRWQAEQRELENRQTDKRGKELREARLSLDVLHQERAKVEAEGETFPPEARVEPTVIHQELHEARFQDQLREKELIEARQHQGTLESLQQQREKLQQQYLEKDRERNVQRLLSELLGKDRLQLYLVRQAERQVVEYANGVLDRLSGGQLYLKLTGEAEGDGSAAKALELEVYNRSTGDKPINVSFLSGSQKFRVAVSLALGIGQYASRQHRPIESVIIDEGFGCLDRQGRQVMIQELQNLRNQMRCILLVSHQEEFADAFSDGYQFRLENGATRVERIQK